MNLEGQTPETVRFFCLGKELQDEMYLYSYDIKDELTIQCMQRKKWNEAKGFTLMFE